MSCCTLYRDGGARTVTERMCACSTILWYLFKSRSWRHFYRPRSRIIISHTPTPKVVQPYEYSCKCLSLCEVIMIAVCCCIICQLRVHSVLSPLWWMNPWLSWHLSMCSIALPWRWAQMPSRWPIQAGLRSYLDYHMSAPSLCSITVQRSTSVGFSVLSSFLMMCWCHRQGFSWEWSHFSAMWCTHLPHIGSISSIIFAWQMRKQVEKSHNIKG